MTYQNITLSYLTAIQEYPSVITGYKGTDSPVGIINSYDSLEGRYHSTVLSSSLFISYCIPYGNETFLCIDENYGSEGSTLYLFKKIGYTIEFVQSISNPAILGGVFILHFDSLLYIPGFASDNIWIVEPQSYKTHSIISTGKNPHGIYFYDEIFYVPCRGERNNENSNYIDRFTSSDLCHKLNPINLSFIQPNMGPRHLCFVDHFMYVITEFSCMVLRIDLNNYNNYMTRSLVDQVSENTTGGEIFYKDSFIYVTLRIKDQSGYFIKFDRELHKVGHLVVGRTPRFFNFLGADQAIVLNQDDESYTLISISEWKVIATVVNLGLSPQCFFQ